MKPQLRLIQVEPCYYCGVIADSTDHVPPRSVRPTLDSLGIRYQIKDVAACRECNSCIGADAPFSLTERKALAKSHLMRKYRSYLEMPDWDDSEIAQLGHRLQQYVLVSMVTKEYIRARLRWPNVTSTERDLLNQERSVLQGRRSPEHLSPSAKEIALVCKVCERPFTANKMKSFCSRRCRKKDEDARWKAIQKEKARG